MAPTWTRGPGDIPAHEISNALRGLSFPAQKDALVAQARRNNADDPVVKCVGTLPARRYDDMQEVEEVCAEYSQHGGV